MHHFLILRSSLDRTPFGCAKPSVTQTWRSFVPVALARMNESQFGGGLIAQPSLELSSTFEHYVSSFPPCLSHGVNSTGRFPTLPKLRDNTRTGTAACRSMNVGHSSASNVKKGKLHLRTRGRKLRICNCSAAHPMLCVQIYTAYCNTEFTLMKAWLKSMTISVLPVNICLICNFEFVVLLTCWFPDMRVIYRSLDCVFSTKKCINFLWFADSCKAAATKRHLWPS